MSERTHGFETLQLHAGAAPDPATGARQVPIYQSTAYVFRDVDHAAALFNLQELGSIYSRLTNPTVAALQERVGFVRRRGRGTLVRSTPEANAPLGGTLDGLLETVGRMGRSTAVRTLAHGPVAAPHQAAAALGLNAGAQVVHIRRVRLLGDQPMSYLMVWIPEDIADLLAGPPDSDQPLLLAIEDAGVEVAGARQTISASVADAEVAGALEVPAGSPLIDVQRVVTDAAGRAVEFIRILYRPDVYRFEVEMQRVVGRFGRRWSSDSEPGQCPTDPSAE